jgi:hypothetical protein
MATTKFYWNDMSGDEITVNYPDSGSGDIEIHSPKNDSGYARSIKMTLTLVNNPEDRRFLWFTQQGAS